MQKPVIEIDGLSFDSLAGFFDVFDTVVLGVTNFGQNLDAFNDVLRGGFGSPDGGFVLRWRNSKVSRDRLGYDETIRFLERKITTCHPSNVVSVLGDLKLARSGEGETLFDIICGIIQNHGPGGEEAEDGIVLELE
ncbi:MAG: barstar family protein [Planctomycetota bacterium]